MLSLAELRRAAALLDRTRRGARVEKIVQTENAELVLQLAGAEDLPPGDRLNLLLCVRPGVARVASLAKLPPAPEAPPQLAQWLRAHLAGARLRGVALEGVDRQLRLRFETREERGSLLFSVLGPRSNVYALDSADRLVAAARPLGETRRDLALGQPWRNPEGGPPGEGSDRFASVADDGLLAAIEAHYGAQEQRRDEASLARRIAQALRRQRSALEKKARLVEEDAREAEGGARFAQLGEALKAHLKDVRPGEASLRARDFASGEPLEIPLDPTLSPAANLEALFKRARRAERKAAAAAQERGETEARLARVAELEARVGAAVEDATALQALAQEEDLARWLARFAPQPTPGPSAEPERREFRIGKTVIPTRLAPKIYRTSDGLEIWVGKSDEGNDLLSTRLARGNDLFFHLEGNPGSHVVLRTAGSADAPQESVLEAAELAVHFSKAKGATRASVHIAPIKNVSKPGGAKPGLVYVTRGRTLQLRRDPARLERILAARVED